MLQQTFKNIFQKLGYRLIKENYLNKYYRHINDHAIKSSGDFVPLDYLFHMYLKDDFTFVQIGANNGRRDDPINHLLVKYKEDVKGIAVEPVQEYFDELQITYETFPKIKLVKKAIHNSESEKLIYKINPSLTEIEDYYRGMASFDRSNFTKDGVSDNNIISEKIACTSLMNLLREEKINKLHLLQIDAEGYDIEIIRSIDFNKIKPRIINFEHRWEFGLISDNEMLSIIKLLMDNKYKLIINGNDAIAYL